MLGGTLPSLDNELSFVRRSLSVFQAGDLLLLDVAPVAAPLDRPDQIRKLDPRLSGAIPADWTPAFDEWLGGPLWRYGRNVESVTFHPELTLRNCIPGSYCIEYLADVTTPAGKRSFAMHHWKRYDTDALSQALRESGWETLVVLPFSDNYPRVLLLARKSH